MSEKDNPLVSIVVPSYNQGAFIRQTIESCLEQDYRPIEIIVMDGASTDNTVEVLESFGDIPELNWISEPDDGVVDAVNKGLKKATGEIAAIQSSDDYYLSGCFSQVVDAFQKNSDAGLVFGDAKRVDADGRALFSVRQPSFSMSRLLSREVIVNQQSAFFRRELALDIGGWNPEIPYVPDADLWMRLAFHSKVIQCSSALAVGRRHPDQRDTNGAQIYADYLKMHALSSELMEARISWKRAAQAGRALLKFRYGGPWTQMQLTCAAWTAVLNRPALWRSSALQRHHLIPGYFALTRLKRILGTLVYDWPRLAWALALSGHWLFMRNRNDVISASPDRGGVRCDWTDTRPIHLCNVFPFTGSWLLHQALKSRPIPMKERPDTISDKKICRNGAPVDVDVPDVSFVIGHRGLERVPLLLMTLKSIAAQEDVSFECIVVEQDAEPLIRDSLPGWVRYLYTPLSDPDQPYNRSKTFNDGARLAQGKVLILHDNDMLVSACYAATVRDLFEKGYEVSQLKRFIFYLNETSTQTMVSEEDIPDNMHCEQVIENLCGGGSLAISKEVYLEIGGMDEEFVGWGGEDAEFWDRCLTRKVWGYAMLPIIHLRHSPQPGKRAVNGQGALTAELTDRRRAMSARARILELMMRDKQRNGDTK